MDRLANSHLLAFLALLSLAFLWPIHLAPWPSFVQEYLAGIGLLVAATGVLVFSSQNLRLNKTILIIFTMALLPIVQWAFGLIVDFGGAFVVFIYLMGFGLAIAVGYNWQIRWKSIANRPTAIVNPINSLVTVILICAIISSGLALYQWLDLSYLGALVSNTKQGGGGRVSANLGQANHLGSLVFMGLVAAFYLYHKGSIGRLVLALLAGFLVLALVLCGSRTIWITATLSFIWIVSKRNRVTDIARMLVPMSLCVLWYLLLSLILIPALEYSSNPEQLTSLRPMKLLGRSLIWPQMLDAIRAGEWWGYGWNQTSVAQIAVAHLGDSAVPGSSFSHNLFLDLMLWNGPVLGTVIIGMILYWAWLVASRCHSAGEFYLLWAIGVLAVHSMLEFPFAYAYFLILLGLMVGAVDAMNDATTIRLPYQKWILTPALAGSLYLLVVIGQEYKQLEGGMVDLVRTDLQTDRGIGSGSSDVIFLTHLQDEIRLRNNPPREGMTLLELNQMASVASRSTIPSVLNNYALSLGINHYYSESEKVLKVIFNLYRKFYPNVCHSWKNNLNLYPQLSNVEMIKPLLEYPEYFSKAGWSRFNSLFNEGPCSPNQAPIELAHR